MPIETITRPATAHGWLRRPEMDSPYSDSWELPNGQIKIIEKGVTPLITVQYEPPDDDEAPTRAA